MITANGLELRAGARLLRDAPQPRIQAGDRIGLVGRIGAGKTTLLRTLAGQGLPAADAITANTDGPACSGPVNGELGPGAGQRSPIPGRTCAHRGPGDAERATRTQSTNQQQAQFVVD